MSNVLDRFKNVSDMAFYQNMVDIQRMFNMLLMGKYTPRKYRQTYAVPTTKKVQKMIDKIVELNNINVKATPVLYEYKKKEQKKLVNKCNVLYSTLQTLINIVWYQRLRTEGQAKDVLVTHIEKLSRMIERESVLLIGWMNSTKL